MSTNPSNLYAERILSEHPLAMWSLDDTSDYVSLISESFRDISTWTILNSTGTVASISSTNAPFSESYTTSITGTVTPTQNFSGITYLRSASNFSTDSEGYSVSFYIKASDWVGLSCGYGGLTANISQISVSNLGIVTYQTTTSHGLTVGDYVQVSGTTFKGDSYYDGSGQISAVTSNTFQIAGRDGGFGTGETHSSSGTVLEGKTQYQNIDPASYPKDSWIPISFSFSDQVTSKKLVLNFVYNDTSPTYHINGLAVGKNSEPFSLESFGQSLITLPTSIATTQTKGLEAKSFGTQEYSAYYIGEGNDLYAKNAGMSLSYGSENSMIVYPHNTAGQPSFIFPGFGMLNSLGRYKEFTLETLIRINANNSTPKRIIGPLASTDGIYVDKDFLILKINDNVGYYNVSELFRPMVLQLQMGLGYANLTIDGDTVISLQVDNETLTLPSPLDGSSDSQDWFGIFGYSDIQTIEIDSIAIYPYKCSGVLGKRRLVYAQGLDIPQIANTTYNGSTILSDYTYANYTNNYNYPSFQAAWEQAGIVDNFDTTTPTTLSSRTFADPDILVSTYTKEQLLSDSYQTYLASSESNAFINLKPSTVVSGSDRSWSAVNTSSIYTNSFDKNSHLSGGIYGVFKSVETSGTEQVLVKLFNEQNGQYFKISLTGTTVSYIISDDGVSEDVLDTASITQGTIFGVGVDVQKLKNLDTFLNILFSNTNELVLYVGGQETSTKTFSGNIYKVGLCSEISFAEISDGFDGSGILTSPTSYLDLLSKTASYTIVPTSIFNSIKLSVAANAYWQDYIPLSKLAKSVVDANGVESLSLDFIQLNFDHQEPRQYSSGKFDTSKQSAKTYVTFQTLASGSNKPLSDFTTTVLANETRIVNATTFSALSKYEFVNGMIIYPPTNVNLNTLAMVIHIELNNSDSNLKKFNFRRLQLAAQSFNKNSANPIGTKYGVDLYSDSGSAQNPYLVYKDNTPYLYLTKHSGFRMLGSTSNLYATLGSLSEQTKVSSIQMSILSDIKEFPTTSQKIFSITGNSGTVNFYVRALGFTDTTKGFIYSDSPDVGGYAPAYYLNGKLVANPVIELNEWNVLGVAFGTPVNISNKIGRLTIFSRLLIDNISVYNANPIEIDQKSTSILWSEIKGEANKWVTEIPTQTPGRSGNSITISTTVPHNLVVGEKIQILGVEPINYRNEWLDISTGTLYDVELSVSAVPSSTSFTYENSLTSAAPITTAGTVVGTWQYASIPNYYRINSNNIKSIYKIHLGTFKTVIDTDEESKKLMLSGYQYSAYTDVKINTITLDVL